MRVLTNLTILVIEFALIGAAAWAAYHSALWFAVATAVLTVVIGWQLELARLRHEYPFYVPDGRAPSRWRPVLFATLASGETLLKAVLGGAAAVLTFSGNDMQRLAVLAVILAGVTFLGTSVLRRLSRSFGVHPMRWGYFRLVVPLGIAFSLAIQLATWIGWIEVKSLSQIANTIVFDLPARPSLNQISEFLFDVKQTLDAVIHSFLNQLMPPTYATLVGVVVSLNMLSGFVVAVYAVIIASIVDKLERAWL